MDSDPIIPIAAEFGEPEPNQAIPANKPLEQGANLEAFKKEMEKKATTVHEKDREEKRSQANEEHQIDEMKPLIKEAITEAQAKATPELRLSKSSSTDESSETDKETPIHKRSSHEVHSQGPSEPTTKNVDHLTNKLPDPHTIEPTTKKPKVTPTQPPIQQAPKAPVEAKVDTTAPLEKTREPLKSENASGQNQNLNKHKQSSDPMRSEPVKEKKPAPKMPQMPLQKAQEAPKTMTPHKTSSPEIAPTLPSASKNTPKPVAPQEPINLDAPLPPQEQPGPDETKIDTSKKPQPHEAHIPHMDLHQPEEQQPLESEKIEDSPVLKQHDVVETKTHEQELDPTQEGNSPFALPYPLESKKKEDLRSSKDGKQDEDETKIEGTTGASSIEKDKKDQGGGDRMPDFTPGALSAAASDSAHSNAFAESIGFDRLHPQVLQLMDRLVGVITVMQVQGKTETSVQLNEQQFPNLKGTEIVISRFDTASRAYNIDLRGPPEAVKILQKDVETLKKTFSSRKKEFNFEVSDITISLRDDKA